MLENAAQRDMRRLLITLNKAARLVLMCGFEKGVGELHIIMAWSTVVEHVRLLLHYCQKFN